MKYDITTMYGTSTISLSKEQLMQVFDERYNRTLAHLLALNNPWFTIEDKDILFLEDKFWGTVLRILAYRGKIDTESESILTTTVDNKPVFEIYFENLVEKLYDMKAVHISVTGIHMYLMKNPDSNFVRRRKYRVLVLMPYILEKYTDNQIQLVWDILQYRISGKPILESLVEGNNLSKLRRRVGEEMYQRFIQNLVDVIKKVNKVTLTEIRRSDVLRLLSKLQQEYTSGRSVAVNQ